MAAETFVRILSLATCVPYRKAISPEYLQQQQQQTDDTMILLIDEGFARARSSRDETRKQLVLTGFSSFIITSKRSIDLIDCVQIDFPLSALIAEE